MANERRRETRPLNLIIESQPFTKRPDARNAVGIKIWKLKWPIIEMPRLGTTNKFSSM